MKQTKGDRQTGEEEVRWWQTNTNNEDVWAIVPSRREKKKGVG
jgi:hypothetical protein